MRRSPTTLRGALALAPRLLEGCGARRGSIVRLAFAAILAGAPAAALSASGHEAPPKGEAHGEAHGEAGKAGKGGHGEAEAPAPDPAASERYVHHWIPLPQGAGIGLGRAAAEDEQVRIAPRRGRATVILFLASWCEPCQQMVTDYTALAQRYARLDVDFVYVFTHDTRGDAEGFMKEFGIGSAVLGNLEILKAYHNPELPTVYVGDRQGWLATRFTKTGTADLKQLDELLRSITAL